MYLSQVKISDFRAFPPDFSLDIHPGPGVTLLVGQNGLGKSTFIEAIEWCLTGSVRRLADVQNSRSKSADYLRRRSSDGSQADSYSVTLRYGDTPETTQSVIRSLGQDAAGNDIFKNSSPESIVELLKNPQWAERVDDVAQYLRLTHFLSQSVEQRFAARDPNDRWSALEAPAGTERLNRAREMLGSGGLTKAFNEREKLAEEGVKIATLDLQRWQELLHRRDSLKQMLGSSGGSDPAEILPALAALLREVRSISQDPPRVVPVSAANQDIVLRDVGDAIRSITREIAELRTRAEAAKELPREWIECINNRARIQATEIDQRRTLEELTNGLTLRRGEVSKALDRRNVAANEQRIAKERLPIAQSALNARQELDRVRDQLSQAVESERIAAQSYSEAARLLALANESVVSRRKLEQDWVSAVSRRKNIIDTQVAVSSLKGIAVESGRLGSVRLESNSRITKIRTDRDTALAEAEKLNNNVVELEATAELQRQKVGAIQSAVSVIAAHLNEADCNCPVCSTNFGAGKLRKLAADNSAASDSVLSALESAIKVAYDAAQLAKARARQLEIELTKAEHSLRTVIEEENQWASKRVAVESLSLLEGLNESQYESSLSQLLAAVESEYKAIDVRRIQAGSTSDVDAAAIKAGIDFQAAKSGLEEASRRIDDNRSRLAQLEAILLSGSQELVLPEIEALEAAVRSAVSNVSVAEDNFAKADISHKAASKEESAISGQVTSVTEIIKASQRDLVALNPLAEAILSRWRALGLKGDPSASGLAELLATLDQRDIQLSRVAASHRELVAKLEVWRKAVELRELTSQIDGVLKTQVMSEEAQTEYLKSLIAAGTEHVAAIQAAAEHKTKVVETLQKESTKYTSEVLRPINQLNAAFLRMFSCFSDFTVSLDARTHKANVQLDLVVKWLTAQKAKPSHASVREYLSEGQLSALSVGLLLSMSEMYRWSRWRALLLDDPLQHNDVIHAAAFIEVLRGLVRFEGYQVILSTHDLALAEYIRRKLAAAQIECRTCQFLGIGAHGVLHESS